MPIHALVRLVTSCYIVNPVVLVYIYLVKPAFVTASCGAMRPPRKAFVEPQLMWKPIGELLI